MRTKQRNTGLSDRSARIAAFQAEIAELPQAGHGNVIEIGLGRGTVEHRGTPGWEAIRGLGHVGMFSTSGEAVNALWELAPWNLEATAQWRPQP